MKFTIDRIKVTEDQKTKVTVTKTYFLGIIFLGKKTLTEFK